MTQIERIWEFREVLRLTSLKPELQDHKPLFPVSFAVATLGTLPKEDVRNSIRWWSYTAFLLLRGLSLQEWTQADARLPQAYYLLQLNLDSFSRQDATLPTSGFVAFPIWSRVLLYLLGSLLVIRVGQRPSLFYFPLDHRVNNVVGSLRSLDFPLSIPTLQTFIFAFGYKNPFVEGEDFRDSVKIPVLVS